MLGIETFIQAFGWQLAVIALSGILVLGILKYCKVFDKLTEKNRHYAYMAVTLLYLAAVALIYLLCAGKFDGAAYVSFLSAAFVLNQTAYNIFKVTPLKDLFGKLFDIFSSKLSNKAKQDVLERAEIGEITPKSKKL